MITLTAQQLLPQDGTKGTLVGRVWLPQAKGPAVAVIRDDGDHRVQLDLDERGNACGARHRNCFADVRA